MSYLDLMKKVLLQESDAIRLSAERLTEENISCLESIFNNLLESNASLIFLGVGKSGQIGEKLAAKIATNPNMKLSKEDISNFLSERLAKFKVPEFIWIQAEQLPRIASGKIAKKEMREEAIKELGV